MELVAAVDEVASETQLSEGWTYAVLPRDAVTAVDAAVSGCKVKHFHGKMFKRSQASDYQTLLAATRQQLERWPDARLLFTLLETTWKAKFLTFAEDAITNAMQAVSINDPTVRRVGEHIFPGLITFQRLADNLVGTLSEIEIDSDNISKLLNNTNVQISGVSLPLAAVLGAAYEGHRKKVFPHSPELMPGGLRALDDAHSRCIQIADVFGNFALSKIFVQLGHTSKKRSVKAQIFDTVFGDVLDSSAISAAVALSPPNDIGIIRPGGFTLGIGVSY
jgi:hypothetical protein